MTNISDNTQNNTSTTDIPHDPPVFSPPDYTPIEPVTPDVTPDVTSDIPNVTPSATEPPDKYDDDPPYRIMTEEEYRQRIKQLSDAYDKLDDPNSYEQSMKRMGLIMQTSMLNQRYINSQPWATIYRTKRPKKDDK